MHVELFLGMIWLQKCPFTGHFKLLYTIDIRHAALKCSEEKGIIQIPFIKSSSIHNLKRQRKEIILLNKSNNLFSQKSGQGYIHSGQPEKFPPQKFFPVFVDFFCII